MADNILVDISGGTATLSTDDIAGVHHQRVKMSLGGDGVAVDAPGDATNGLDVDVTRLPALATGSNAIGKLAANDGVDIGDVTINNASLAVTGPLTNAELRAAVIKTHEFFDSSENIFVASVLAAAKAASKNYLSIYNADTTLKVDILRIILCQELTAAVTGLVRGYRAFRFTTLHTGGADIVPLKLDTGMTNLDADITVKSASTIGGAEAIPLAVASINEEETGAGGTVEMFNHIHSRRPITLNQNQGLTVQQDSTAGTGILSVVIEFRMR